MKILSRLIATTLAFSTLAGTAHACFYNKSINMRIAEGYNNPGYSSILMGRVSTAEQIGDRGWAGTAVALYNLSDIPIHPDMAEPQFPLKDKVFKISRTGSSAACDDGIAMPKKDDIWIMYMQEGRVVRAYPMLTAYDNDVNLQTQWVFTKNDGTKAPTAPAAKDKISEE